MASGWLLAAPAWAGPPLAAKADSAGVGTAGAGVRVCRAAVASFKPLAHSGMEAAADFARPNAGPVGAGCGLATAAAAGAGRSWGRAAGGVVFRSIAHVGMEAGAAAGAAGAGLASATAGAVGANSTFATAAAAVAGCSCGTAATGASFNSHPMSAWSLVRPALLAQASPVQRLLPANGRLRQAAAAQRPGSRSSRQAAHFSFRSPAPPLARPWRRSPLGRAWHWLPAMAAVPDLSPTGAFRLGVSRIRSPARMSRYLANHRPRRIGGLYFCVYMRLFASVGQRLTRRHGRRFGGEFRCRLCSRLGGLNLAGWRGEASCAAGAEAGAAIEGGSGGRAAPLASILP